MPMTPTSPSGPPSDVPFGLDDIRMCGANSTRPVIASRRCQIAARSIPSNHSSTHGSVLTRIKAIDSIKTDSAPNACPRKLPVRSPPGRATTHKTPWATTRPPIVAGPTSRATKIVDAGRM